MKNNPLVSVIVNCHNGEKYLQDCLDSIFSQQFKNWQIIFFDNASIDRSKDIIKKFQPKLKYFYSEKKLNLGHARAEALKYVDTKYVAFLDVDDVWVDTFLSSQVEILENNKDIQMSYSGMFIINEKSKVIGEIIPKANSYNVFEQQLINYEVGFQTVLIRYNKFFSELHQNINNFHVGPDYYLILNIAKEKKVFVNKKCLVMHRRTKDSLTHRKPHRWSIELKSTLDDIFKNNEHLRLKLSSYLSLAYAKVYYKKADYFALRNKKCALIKSMNKIKFVNMSYFILFLISCFGTSLWKLIHNRFKM